MKRTVIVTQEIEVTIDETKFDENFMEEFRKTFFPFETVSDHIEHLAQLRARGIAGNNDFIEGYGETEEMGIRFDVIDTEVEIKS